MTSSRWRKVGICTFVIGLLLLIVGVAVIIAFPYLLKSQVKKVKKQNEWRLNWKIGCNFQWKCLGFYFISLFQQVALKQGTWATDQWEDPKFDVYEDFYFFNWTNYKDSDLQQLNYLPKVKQIGPYRYWWDKAQIYFSSINKH